MSIIHSFFFSEEDKDYNDDSGRDSHLKGGVTGLVCGK